MKIACISDTHDIYYPEIPSDVDAVIHAGDITLSGSPDETMRFLRWFESLPVKHKLFIGGNHDRFLEQYGGALLADYKGIQMLWDSSYDLDGYKVWGSPASPAYGHIRAFAKEREALETFWDRIPSDVDIVITHGPAYGWLDQAQPIYGEHLGDTALARRLQRISPVAHICGHIHGSRGRTAWEGIEFINAAVINEAYKPYPGSGIHYLELATLAAEETNADSIRNAGV